MRIPRSTAALLCAAVLVVGASAWHLYAVDLYMPQTYSDLLPRIVGTRDTLRGISPYSEHALHDIQRACYGKVIGANSHLDPQYFSYPALIIPLILPISGLSWLMARDLFLAIVVPLLLLSFSWWARKMLLNLSSAATAAVALMCLGVWPVVWGLRLQQPTVVAFILITGAIASVQKDRGWIAGACLAVAAIKPQIALPITAWLMVWSIRKKRFGIFAAFFGVLGALWLGADFLLPSWFSKWLASLGAYTSINKPLAEMFFSKWFGLGVTVVLAWFCVQQLWGMLDSAADSDRFLEAVALALAATLMVVPMQPIFLYDQVLLVPAVLYAMRESGLSPKCSWLARGAVTISMALVLVSAAVETVRPNGVIWYILPFLSQPLPLVVVIAMLLGGGRKCLEDSHSHALPA